MSTVDQSWLIPWPSPPSSLRSFSARVFSSSPCALPGPSNILYTMAISSHTPSLHQRPLLSLRTMSESCTHTVSLFKICRHIILASLSNQHSMPFPLAILIILCLGCCSPSLAWFIPSAHLHVHTWRRQIPTLRNMYGGWSPYPWAPTTLRASPIIEPMSPDCVNINHICFPRLSASSGKEGVTSGHYYVSDTWHRACLPQCLSLTNPVYHYTCLSGRMNEWVNKW